MRLLAFCFLLKQPPSLCTAAGFARFKPLALYMLFIRLLYGAVFCETLYLQGIQALYMVYTLYLHRFLMNSTVQPFHNLLRSCKNMKRPEPNPNPNR